MWKKNNERPLICKEKDTKTLSSLDELGPTGIKALNENQASMWQSLSHLAETRLLMLRQVVLGVIEQVLRNKAISSVSSNAPAGSFQKHQVKTKEPQREREEAVNHMAKGKHK